MSNTTINMKSEYLTSKEQEFVEFLTDKLIEVAWNPSMRKDFIVQASDTEQYRFFKEDIPSEIENKALFLFNIVNGNYERALLWARQAKDELAIHHMLATYYRYCAIDAPQDADETQSLYLQSLEHASQCVYGISCYLLEEYAEYLVKSGSEVQLIELATNIFAIGLHSMNPADSNIFYDFNQGHSRDEIELIEKMLQLLKEYAETGRAETKDIFMNYYHLESAYYYACTGRNELAKKEIVLAMGENAKYLYDFNNMTDAEREGRHELLNNMVVQMWCPVLEDRSEHFLKTHEYALMAFGYQELPKRPRPKKGSFDWLYNQGEKSYLAILHNKATDKDYATIRAVAEAYRTGNGVRQNLRLADCWAEMTEL